MFVCGADVGVRIQRYGCFEMFIYITAPTDRQYVDRSLVTGKRKQFGEIATKIAIADPLKRVSLCLEDQTGSIPSATIQTPSMIRFSLLRRMISSGTVLRAVAASSSVIPKIVPSAIISIGARRS